MYSIILLGSVGAIATSINTHTLCDNFYNEIQYVRNHALRAILSHELNRTKHKLSIINRMINRNVMNKYNNVLSRCYDANYNYNCLTYAEKTVLEVVVSLVY